MDASGHRGLQILRAMVVIWDYVRTSMAIGICTRTIFSFSWVAKLPSLRFPIGQASFGPVKGDLRGGSMGTGVVEDPPTRFWFNLNPPRQGPGAADPGQDGGSLGLGVLHPPFCYKEAQERIKA